MTDKESNETPRGGRRAEVPPEVREEVTRLAPHYGTREIAKRVGLTRKIVRRVLQEASTSGSPGRTPRQEAPTSLLDPFLPQIRTKVAQGLRATRILREVREKGYRGGRTILTDCVRRLRTEVAPEQAARRVKRRFETARGEELQIDWSVYTVDIGGKPTRVHALGALLCWSRKLYLGFYEDERQSTLLEGLAEAIAYFGGAASRLVLDNMATAVLGRIGRNREPLWHPRFLDFSKHHGFDAFACRVRDPDRKGKKEKSFRLVEDDLLKGSTFASWDDLLARRSEWLDGKEGVGNRRVHGTTGRVPNEAWLEERPFLVALPASPFPVFDPEPRVVDEDATLSIGCLRYTVPASLAPGVVTVRLYARHFEVVDRAGYVAFSRRYAQGGEGKSRLVIDPTHYATLGRGPKPHEAGSGGRLEDAFVARFPDLAPLVTGIKARMKALAGIHLRELIRLAERFGEAAFLAAAKRAQDYRRHDASAVRHILERAHPIAEGELALEPLARGSGPVVLGEVEPCTLDAYAELDSRDGGGGAAAATTTTTTTTTNAAMSAEEATHGA